jgi:hypothetical protein
MMRSQQRNWLVAAFTIMALLAFSSWSLARTPAVQTLPAWKDVDASRHHVPVWQMPQSLWTELLQAQGIRMGGKGADKPQIQVIIDVNCPYSARTYYRFRKTYPHLPVRWVPVGSLLPDSGAMADAIVHSKDPVASLDQNFLHYKFAGKDSHGGYVIPDGGRKYTLPVANQKLQNDWEQWSNRTPTIVFHDDRGRVIAIADSTWTTIHYVVDHVRGGRSGGK